MDAHHKENKNKKGLKLVRFRCRHSNLHNYYKINYYVKEILSKGLEYQRLCVCVFVSGLLDTVVSLICGNQSAV